MNRPLSRFLFALLTCTIAATGCIPETGVAEERAPESARPESVAAASTEATSTRPAAPRTLTPDDLKALAWRSIGPANMGGRVADIAVAPGNPKTFFVAHGTGGIFKTTNRGTTFTPVFDKEATASIGSIVVCDAPDDWPGWKDEKPDPAAEAKPADPKERGKAKIVWVGTGEGNGRNSSSYGNGVYRSTDGGGSWTHLGLAETHDIPALAVDPRNPDVCFVAALGHLWGPNPQRGIYKTTDGGKNWTHVLRLDADTGAIDVRLNPDNPDIVYAAIYMRRRTAYSFRSGGPVGGIYRSTDAGKTWTELTRGLPAQTGRIGLGIYAKNPKVLYAVIESDIGGWGPDLFEPRLKAGGLFRTDDGGDTWTRVSDLNFRPFYFSKVVIDPTDDQRIYLLGFGLSVSDDGGRHFRADGARTPHGDLHVLVIDPADRDHMLLGTDGGVYLSHDRGATWDFLNNLAAGEFYNVAVDLSDPYRVGGGLQDNCTWIGPSATIWQTSSLMGDEEPGGPGGITNADWKFIYGGDGFHVAFDPLDPNIIYCESQGGELVRAHLDTGRRKRIKPAPKEGQPRYRFNWNTPFFISPHDPKTLYVGGNYVFKLTQRGDHAERISEDLSTRDVEKIETVGTDAETHGTVVSLAESPLAAGLLWAGTDDGRVHVTRDDGKHWTDVTPPQTGGRYISKIEPSQHERDTAYVALDGHRSDDMDPHIVMTTDGGKNWTTITGDLPAGAHVKVVREDIANRNVLYCGTEWAAYVSIDRGAHWVRLNGDTLPTVAVDDIVQHPRETDLVAGTHGRSIYILDDASPLSQLTPDVIASEFHLFDVRPGKPVIYLDYGGIWSERIFRAKNPPLGAKIAYWLRDYVPDGVKLSIHSAKGVMVRSLTGPGRPGINRVVWDLQAEKHQRIYSSDESLGQTQFVPPGDYTVIATCGKTNRTKKVKVLPAPGADWKP